MNPRLEVALNAVLAMPSRNVLEAFWKTSKCDERTGANWLQRNSLQRQFQCNGSLVSCTCSLACYGCQATAFHACVSAGVACFDRIACPSGVIASYLHASPSPGLGKMGAVVALVDKQGKLEGAAADKAHVRCQLHTEVMCCFASVGSILSGNNGNADGIEAVCSDVQELGSKIAMHIVAARPLSLDRHSLPSEALEGACMHYCALRK